MLRIVRRAWHFVWIGWGIASSSFLGSYLAIIGIALTHLFLGVESFIPACLILAVQLALTVRWWRQRRYHADLGPLFLGAAIGTTLEMVIFLLMAVLMPSLVADFGGHLFTNLTLSPMLLGLAISIPASLVSAVIQFCHKPAPDEQFPAPTDR